MWKIKNNRGKQFPEEGIFFSFPICQKANEREENVSAMFHSALNILGEVSNGFIAKESISPSLIVRDNFGNEQGEGFSKLNHNKLMMMVYNNTNKNRTITEPRMEEQCNITSPSITAIVIWLMNIFPHTLSLITGSKSDILAFAFTLSSYVM